MNPVGGHYWDKESLYDQNIMLKMAINEIKEENVRIKTKATTLENALNSKDKLIEELYKTAFITASGVPAKQNLNKDVYIALKLKR